VSAHCAKRTLATTDTTDPNDTVIPLRDPDWADNEGPLVGYVGFFTEFTFEGADHPSSRSASGSSGDYGDRPVLVEPPTGP
jgi:hypothetical protein